MIFSWGAPVHRGCEENEEAPPFRKLFSPLVFTYWPREREREGKTPEYCGVSSGSIGQPRTATASGSALAYSSTASRTVLVKELVRDCAAWDGRKMIWSERESIDGSFLCDTRTHARTHKSFNDAQAVGDCDSSALATFDIEILLYAFFKGSIRF